MRKLVRLLASCCAARLLLVLSDGYGADLCSSATNSISGNQAANTCILNTAGESLDVSLGATLGAVTVTGSAGSFTNSGTVRSFDAAPRITGGLGGGITNNATGILDGNGGSPIYATGTGTIVGISNAGLVTGWNAIALGGSAVTNGITNTGTLTGTVHGGINIWAGSISGGVTNTGTVSGSTWGIYVQGSGFVSGGILNSGTISGSNTGISLTVADPIRLGGITNTGTISGGSYALNLTNTTPFTIVNQGTLSGAVNLGVNRLDLDGPTSAVTGAVVGTAGSSVYVNGTFSTQSTFAGVGDFVVSSGGVLSVQNAISSTNFTNNGTVRAAAGTTGGLTTAYTQTSAGFLKTDLSSDIAIGRFSISGTANLPTSAKIIVNVVGSPTLTAGNRYAGVLTATSLISDGTFNVTDNSPAYNFRAQINGNAVDLITENALSIADSLSTVRNSKATGAGMALDKISAQGTASTDMSTVLTAISGLTTDAEISRAVDQTLPLLGGETRVISSFITTQVGRAVRSRRATSQFLTAHYEADKDRNFWIKPVGLFGRQKASNDVSGYSSTAGGAVSGLDAEFSDVLRLGVAYSYVRSSATGRSSLASHTLTTDYHQLIGYVEQQLDHITTLDYQVSYGRGITDGLRSMKFVGRVASSAYQSSIARVGLGASRKLNSSNGNEALSLLRIEHIEVRDPTYQEGGAGALSLTVNKGRFSISPLTAGVDISHKVSERTTFDLTFSSSYDLTNQRSKVLARYSETDSDEFTVLGRERSPVSINSGFGFRWKRSRDSVLSARYDGEFRGHLWVSSLSASYRATF
jgi:uncharacterized protein with beta-barrel porin domain